MHATVRNTILLTIAFALAFLAAPATTSAQVQPGPGIVISPHKSGKAVLSWPGPASDYVLQESPDLSPQSWIDSTGTVTNTNSVAIDARSKFYRLRYVGNPTGEFTLGAPMMTQVVGQGGTTSFDIAIFPENGFNSPVWLGVSGLPAGTTGAFNPNPARPLSNSGSAAALNVVTTTNTAPGNYNLTVTAICGSMTRTTWLTLLVVAPDFSIYPSKQSQAIPPGAETTYPFFINKTGGFTDPINLSVTGVPNGATAVFASNPVNTNEALLTVTTTTNVALGTYNLTLVGSTPGLTRSNTVELVVSRSVDFSITSPMMTIFANQGSLATFGIFASQQGNFGGAIKFSVTGLPEGLTYWFDPNSAVPPSDFGLVTTLNVQTLNTTPASNYNFVVTGTCGNLARNTYFSLLLTAPDFGIYPSPYSQSIAPGQSTNFTVYVGNIGGFSNAVDLTVSGLPTGASSYWSKSAGDSSVLNILTTPSTPTGTYTLTITGTSGKLTHSQTVELEIAPPDFTLENSPGSQSVNQGESTTYTISVAPLRGYSGYVKLSFDGLPDGATAWFNHDWIYTHATLNVTTSPNTPAGSYTIHVTGTEGSLTRTTSVMLTVYEPRAFSLSASPASKTVNPGAKTSFTVSTTRTGGYNDLVNLSVSGLPTGASASFSTPTMTIMDVQSTLNITTGTGTPKGTYPLTITGLSGDLTRTATATLVVQAAGSGDFSLDPFPDSQNLMPGSSTTYSIGITRSGGFSGPVNLSISGLPTGATGTFSPNPCTGSSSTLTINSQATTPAGTTTPTVTATSGSLTHSADLTLTVGTSTSPDFTITTSPSSRTISAGMAAGYDLVIKSVNGFYYSRSSWEVTGLPAGLTGQVVVPLPENGGPFINVTASSQAPTGTFNFTVTATLSGGNATKTHSATGTVTVSPPDFSLSLSPDTRIMAPGSAASFEVGITPIAGFYYSSGSWSISGLPQGMSGSVYVPINGAPILNVKAGSTLNPGTNTVTLTANLWGGSGSRTHSATATVIVHEPDFNLSLSPASATVTPGGVGGYTIEIESIAGFAYDSADWEVTGLPSGISYQVVVPFPENGKPFINVYTTSQSPKGTYPFTLKATLWGVTGSQTHSTTGSITVGSQ